MGWIQLMLSWFSQVLRYMFFLVPCLLLFLLSSFLIFFIFLFFLFFSCLCPYCVFSLYLVFTHSSIPKIVCPTQGIDEDDEYFPPIEDFHGTKEDDEEFSSSGDFKSSEDDYANGGYSFPSGEFKGINVDDDDFPPSEDFQGTNDDDENFPPSENFQGTSEDDEEFPSSGDFKSSEDDYVDGGQFFPGGQFKGINGDDDVFTLGKDFRGIDHGVSDDEDILVREECNGIDSLKGDDYFPSSEYFHGRSNDICEDGNHFSSEFDIPLINEDDDGPRKKIMFSIIQVPQIKVIDILLFDLLAMFCMIFLLVMRKFLLVKMMKQWRHCKETLCLGSGVDLFISIHIILVIQGLGKNF
jgi:hypothetical protein